MNEVRSGEGEIGKDRAEYDIGMVLAGAVGGRQGAPAAGLGGGGYLSSCTSSNFPPDPRLAELREIGLKPIFLEIADAIGMDAFLTMWRMLSSVEHHLHDNGSTLRISMRSYRAYQRYQRNRFICSLDSEGVNIDTIQTRLKKQLGEDLSTPGIICILRESRSKVHTRTAAVVDKVTT